MTRTLFRVALTTAAAILLAACTGGPKPTTSPVHPSLGSLGPRPSSTATVTILEPEDGSKITGSTVHIVLKLDGATITTETTVALRPDQGHVHLYVNNALVSMNYGLEQDIPVQPGTLVLKAEFVAADHAPFNPRVWSGETIFTVQ